MRNELRNAYLKPTVFFGAEGLGLRAKGLSVHVMIAAWDLGDYSSLPSRQASGRPWAPPR